MLRTELSKFGYDSLLEGVADDADDRKLMGRLVEIGSPLGDDGKKQPSRKEFDALVAASRFVAGKDRDALLSRVRRYTQQENSPFKMMAHEALAPIESSSADAVKHAREQQIAESRKQATGKVYGCCAGHEF